MPDPANTLNGTPLVSVVVPTYQHAAYIEQCIQGILMQETAFPVEILIGEDESTDGTREICQRLAAEHPDRIRLFLRSRKEVMYIMGRATGRANLLHLLSEAKGKYIALCEGDDYWTDPLKLRKQVDHLENHPEDVLCFHVVGVEKPDGQIVEDWITKLPKGYETQEMLARRGNYIHTPSVVFRNVLGQLPEEFNRSPVGDYFLWVLLACHGKLHCFPEAMANYRLGGTWSIMDNYQRHYRTAMVHATLHTWATRSGKKELSGIFLNRLRSFLHEFRKELTLQDLKAFCALGPEVDRLVARARRGMVLHLSWMDSKAFGRWLVSVITRAGKAVI